MAASKITAAIAADELGINRTRSNDIAPMVKALGLMSWNNTPEETRRREVGAWALRNWKAYQAECQRRRDLRSERPTPVAKALRVLVAEVNAYLDGNDDEEMHAASEAASGALQANGQLEGPAAELLAQADAHLDGNDDDDMQAAAEALRVLLPAPSALRP